MSTSLKALFCALALTASGCGLAGTAPAPVTPAQQSPAAAAPAAGTAVPFETYEVLRTGGDPEKALPRTDHVRISSQADLDAFLALIGAEPGTRARVDFTKQEILAFYQPGGGNGCDDRTLRSLTASAAGLKPVYASENDLDPDAERACTMVMILPGYDLYVIDRTAQPVEGVKAYAP